jgi:hypothetical protein
MQRDTQAGNSNDAETRVARLRLDRINAFLLVLARMQAVPTTEDPPLLKRIRQSIRYELWRLGHPYHPDVCVRLIVHFHGSEAVVVLVGGDKLGVSDQWYDTAVNQANAALDHYYRQHPIP